MINFKLETVNEETRELIVEECDWVDKDNQRKHFKYVKFNTYSKACEKSVKTPHIFVGVDVETEEFVEDMFFNELDYTSATEVISLVIKYVVEPIAKRLKKGFLHAILEDTNSEYGINIYVAPHAYAIEYFGEPGKIYPYPDQKFTEVHKLSKYYRLLFKCIWDMYEKKYKHLQGELRESFLWSE